MLVVLAHKGDHVVNHLVCTHEGSSSLGPIRNYAASDLLSDGCFAIEQHGKFPVEMLALFTGRLHVWILGHSLALASDALNAPG